MTKVTEFVEEYKSNKVRFNLKICILLSPSNSGSRSFRQISNFSFEEPGALVDEVVGSNGAVELVPVNCQTVIGDV